MEYKFTSSCTLPTDKGNYEMRVYKHILTGQDAMALVVRVKHGANSVLLNENVGSERAACVDGCLLRVQDQCMTSEIFGSVKCDCKQQLDYSMELLQQQAQMRYKAWSKQGENEAEGVGSRSSMRTHSIGAGTSLDSDSERSTGDELSVTCYQGHEAGVSSERDALPALTPAARSTPIVPVPEAQAQAQAQGGRAGAGSAQNTGQHALERIQPQSEAGRASPSGEGLTASGGLEDIVGLVVYLLQEGRGIGIAAKIAAYALQEGGGEAQDDSPASGRGLDTVDANRALGLPDDVRTYGAVRDILLDLGCMRDPGTGEGTTLQQAQGPAAMPSQQAAPAGHQPIYLLTNNPRKIASLKTLGVPLAGRVACAVPPPSELAAEYLRVKALRMGHMLPAEGI